MKNLQPDDFMNYQYLSGLSVAPGGRHAAFLVSKCDLEDNSYKTHVYSLDLQNRKLKRLAKLAAEHIFLWLDDRRILFPSHSDKTLAGGGSGTTFFAVDINAGEAYEYMTVPLKVRKILRLAPDKFLVLAKTALAAKTADPFSQLIDEYPYWRNGEGFVSGARSRLYIYDRSVGQAKPITRPQEEVQIFDEQAGKVVFTVADRANVQKPTSSLHLYEISSGQRRTLVAADKYRIRYGGFVGGEIVMAASQSQRYGLGENCFFYKVSENGAIQLLKEYDRGVQNSIATDCKYGEGKVFGADGTHLYFTSTEYSDGVIRRLNLAGAVEDITRQSGSVDCFDLCEDGVILIGFRNYRLQEVYFMQNGAEIKLTNFNGLILEQRNLSLPERLTVESAGSFVEGFVIKPVGYDHTKLYPAILSIHGGPRIAYGKVFFHEFQCLANLGYFVFYCNPRGSDGRGNDFSDIRGKYGNADYNDIMRFTDAVLEHYPQIDANRVGVYGGSYGGFMTNWIIGHTDRFRCAVSMRGIANWVSFFTTADCGYDFVVDQQEGSPWKNAQKLWDHSPLKYADRVKTPTLFLHADEDYRCWLAEGLQMYSALKYHGVPTKMRIFHKENHELSRSGRPAARRIRLEEIIAWFGSYLHKMEEQQ